MDIEKLRKSMKKSADEIKAVVDVILTENNAKLDTIERTILDEMVEEEKTSQEYISSLEKMIEDFENAMSSAKPTDVLRVSKDKSNISVAKSAAGETVLPEFEKGAVIKGEIEEQFGKICQRPQEFLKEEDKILRTEKRILNTTIKSTVQNVSSVVQILKVDLCSICSVFHLSAFKFGFWASDDIGNLGQFNKEVYPLTKGPCVPNAMGFHTISHAGDLIFIHKECHAVCKLNNDMTVTYIINTKGWEPTSICFSHINRNILLGMVKGTEQMVARYRKKKTQYREQDRCYLSNLCENITYLTENINGDICISDSEGNKVFVVTASGEFRFSYLGHQSQSGFLPFGICSDVLGHILVCNDHRDSVFDNSSIHILDKNGTFLFLLPAPEQCPLYPGALCIDDHQNLLVGCYTTPTLTVYKYMHLFTEDK